MKKIENNDLSPDLNASVLATKLVTQYNSEIDSVYILPVGLKRRPYDKEVQSIVKFYIASKQKEGRIIKVHREGLYDMLPEGIFHQPPTSDPNTIQKDILRSIARQREEESSARRFFSPFEAELNFLRINSALQEMRLNDKKNRNGLLSIFELRWTEFSLLSVRQAYIWMHTLPLISQKKNDYLFLKQLLQHLFVIPISIEKKKVSFSPEADEGINLQAELNSNTRLGVDAVIGNPSFQEDGLVITVFPSSDEQLLSFLPNRKGYRIVEMVLMYLLPSFTSYKLIVCPIRPKKAILEATVDSPYSYLGWTVYI